MRDVLIEMEDKIREDFKPNMVFYNFGRGLRILVRQQKKAKKLRRLKITMKSRSKRKKYYESQGMCVKDMWARYDNYMYSYLKRIK